MSAFASWQKRLVQLSVLLAATALLIQLVPIGRDHTNPVVSRDAPWATPAERRLVAGACYDCHSNQTEWQWYSSIAPVSWWTASHVDEGRSVLNFSEWDRHQDDDELVESVEEGSMPPRSYTLAHPAARMTARERADLVRALEALPDAGR